jgi:TolB-like protein/Tfp pilus assembly protein PilF
MKRCPECKRNYFDDSLLYCLDDGSVLLEGPASVDEPATAILHEKAQREAPTRAQIHTTAAEPRASAGGEPEKHSRPLVKVSAPRRIGGRQLAGISVVVLFAVGGVLGWRYFLSRQSEQINSIAVMPLVNQSGNADTDYLSDGIAESLIFRLSQLPALKVSPVSSVIRYKGKEFDAQQIATELGVQAVMSGRMAQRGENLTISIELIDAFNNKVIWGEQFERKMSDLLAVQREIASTITQKLQLKLSGNETGLVKKYTNSSEAYELYLRGRFHFARRSKLDLERSVELLQQATMLDPEFALAYVGIAEAYSSMTSYPYMEPTAAYPLANSAITRALQLDPDLPEAHAVSGMIGATYEWDYAKAEREFKRGIELGPNLAITHYRYAWVYLSPLGRHDEAVAEMRRAMELEPLSIQQGANYAAVLMYAGRFDEALEQAKKTNELDPTHVGGLAWLAHAYNAKGLFDESLALSQKLENVTSYQARAQRGISYALSGQRGNALSVVNEWKEVEKTGYTMIYWLAATYALLGDKDAAFAELEKSYRARDWFLQRLKTDPFMEPLRGDPRYTEMLKRLNLPE